MLHSCLLVLVVLPVAFGAEEGEGEGEGFWGVHDEVAALRQAERIVEAFERLPRLDALATTDAQRAYALGERVYLHSILGTPDRAAAPFRRMRELFARLSPARNPGALFGELEYELPYRLAVDDFAGAVRRVDEARRDPRWSIDRPWAAASRLRVERQWALALAAWARQGGVAVDEALVALRRVVDEFGYRGAEILLRIGTIALERGRSDEARAALRDAEEQVADWREEGIASDLDELNLAVLRARVALAGGDGGTAASERDAARRALAERWERGLDRWAIEDAEGGVGILHHDLRQDALSALVRLTIALGEGPEAALLPVVATQEASALARSLGAGGRSVEELRRAIVAGADHLVVVLLPASLGGEAFVLGHEGVVHHPIEPADDPDGTRFGRDGVPPLPAPVRRRLGAARRVTVCAIGPWAAASFERIEGVDGRPLATTHALDFAPSLPAAAALADRARARVARFAALDRSAPRASLVSGPVPSPAATERWDAVREVPLADLPWDEAMESYPADLVATATGAAATAEAFARLGGAPVLQVFAHGVLDDRPVRPATLVLAPAGPADDGLFTCADAERPRDAQLVFLGSCAASAGPYRGGDEAAADLAGAFLVGGAAAVVASAARIDARETLDVARRFHRHLAGGASPAEALRRARVERDGAPFDGLRVVGAGQVPVFAASVSRAPAGGRTRAVVVGAVLGLVALSLFVVGRAARAR